MVELNNTFKIVITNNDETKEEVIFTGPIVFSIVTSPNGDNFKYSFQLREYSNEYNVDENQLISGAKDLIKNFNREKISSIGAYFLTVSDDYRLIFERKINNIEEINFEYNNDIGDQQYAVKYKTMAKLEISYNNE